MAQEREGSEEERSTEKPRRFEELEPRAFFGDWPNGEIAVPEGVQAPFASDEQRAIWVRALELHRELVLDYRHFLISRTREYVAEATGISPGTLSKVNVGERPPSFDTYVKLRAFLPEIEQAVRNEARLQALVEERWVEDETQARLKAAVQQAVEAELRRRRPSR